MRVKTFLNDDSGAVTVDWVMLTAAIVGIAIAVLVVISGGLNTSINASNDTMATTQDPSALISDS